NKLKKAIVQVEYYGRPARLVLTKRASEVGRAWLKYEDDGNEFEASIKEVNLVAIVEG
ncbi:transcriptional repressor KorB C-terminal beta-barrel domain-containing protein, partial [Xylella fastidiosa]